MMIDKTILIGKKIKEINVTGYGITLITEDDICLDYSASDGGYSTWDIFGIKFRE